MRTNKIFREVSRGLGGDWRPIFDELMAPFPREVAELELGKVGVLLHLAPELARFII